MDGKQDPPSMAASPLNNTKRKQTIMTALIVAETIFGLLVIIITILYIIYRNRKIGFTKVMMMSVFKNIKKISKKKIKDLAKNYSEN